MEKEPPFAYLQPPQQRPTPSIYTALHLHTNLQHTFIISFTHKQFKPSQHHHRTSVPLPPLHTTLEKRKSETSPERHICSKRRRNASPSCWLQNAIQATIDGKLVTLGALTSKQHRPVATMNAHETAAQSSFIVRQKP